MRRPCRRLRRLRPLQTGPPATTGAAPSAAPAGGPPATTGAAPSAAPAGGPPATTGARAPGLSTWLPPHDTK
eukprot:1122327-Lingulodinium_polyedra.AAC.1